MLIDSHCHLDHFSEDELPRLLLHAEQAGLKGMLTIGTKLSEAKRQVSLTKHSTDALRVWCTVGTHPDNSDDIEPLVPEDIMAYCHHEQVIGIGEAGLDYFHGEPSVRSLQQNIFRAHIAASRSTGLPVVIHSRDADSDMAGILQEETHQNGAFPFLLHCFSSGPELAKTAIELGGYVSFSGILTFPKAQAIRDIAKNIPKNRILVETDSPYLAPVPHRGKRNEPAFVSHTAQKLAEVLDISFADVKSLTTDNFFSLFKKAQA